MKEIIEENAIEKLSAEVFETFQKHKILTSKLDDDAFYLQMKLKSRVQYYNNTSLNLTIAPTTGCNFRCPYCFERGVKTKSMSSDVEKKLLEFIKKSRAETLNITWYGGEPLLMFPTIKRLMNSISALSSFKSVNYSMVTNGYMLTEPICTFFNDFSFKTIQVTIDGLPNTHNRTRILHNGEGTFEHIITNIDRALNLLPKCKFLIRVNINENNQDDFHKLKQMLEKRWEDKNVSIYFSYIESLGNCREKCFSNNNKIDFIKNLYQEHGMKDLNLYPKFKTGGCGINCLNSFVVGPDGSLYKCWADLGVEKKIFGSIIDNSNSNSILLSKYMLETDKFSDPLCRECFLFPVCEGGCGLKRFENKFEAKEHNICPYSAEDIQTLLELFYRHNYKQNSLCT